MNEPRFTIGTKYKSPGKSNIEFIVTDVFKVYNSANELVRVYYSSKSTGDIPVTAGEVSDSTIFRNLINKPNSIPTCQTCGAPEGEQHGESQSPNGEWSNTCV